MHKKSLSLILILLLGSILPLLFIVPVFADAWVSPTGFNDPSSDWENEPNAYDDIGGTYTASYDVPAFGWTGWIELLHAELTCNKIRYWIPTLMSNEISDMIVEAKIGGVWTEIFHGAPVKGVWVEKSFAEGTVTGVRFKFYNRSFIPIWVAMLDETDFWEIEAGDETAPTYSDIGTNASHCREVCEFSCLWEDETELSGYIFGWNGTGPFSNDTWTSLSGTSEWANKTKTLPNNDCIVSFQWWCNDTSNNWNTTELQTLNVTDCYIFSRFTFSVSNPEPNENIFFNGSYSRSSSAITSYEWTFGDGNSDSGATVTHSYSTENTFSITLNVTSTDGSDTFTLNLTVAETQVTGEEEGSSGGLYSLLVHVTWNQVPCFANVTVQNSQGNDSVTRQTDLVGNAKFNLPMGIYFVSTSYRNHTLEDTVHLNENSVASFDFKVKGGPTWVALLAVIIVLAIGYVWMNQKKKTRKHKATLEPRSHKPTTEPRKHEDNLKPRKSRR